MAKDKSDENVDYKKLVEQVQEMQNHKHTLVSSNATANTTWGNPQWQTSPQYNHQIYTPAPPPAPMPHFNLGTEEENAELLAMMDCLGVEPTENYFQGFMIIIGDKWYSFQELLVKQMQFMSRINILLCHRGTDDQD